MSLYSPKYVEEVFSEVRRLGVLGSSRIQTYPFGMSQGRKCHFSETVISASLALILGRETLQRVWSNRSH
jgi:hypothetical protein